MSRSRHSAFNKPGMSSYHRSSGSSSSAEKDAERSKTKKLFQGASSASPLRSSFDYAKAVKKHNASSSSQSHGDQQKMNPYFQYPLTASRSVHSPSGMSAASRHRSGRRSSSKSPLHTEKEGRSADQRQEPTMRDLEYLQGVAAQSDDEGANNDER